MYILTIVSHHVICEHRVTYIGTRSNTSQHTVVVWMFVPRLVTLKNLSTCLNSLHSPLYQSFASVSMFMLACASLVAPCSLIVHQLSAFIWIQQFSHHKHATSSDVQFTCLLHSNPFWTATGTIFTHLYYRLIWCFVSAQLYSHPI